MNELLYLCDDHRSQIYFCLQSLMTFTKFVAFVNEKMMFWFFLFSVWSFWYVKQRPLREIYGLADLEKGRGRLVDRRRPTHDGDERHGSRAVAQLVAERLNSDTTGESGGARMTRVYRLYNRCSRKYVRIAGRRVDAVASLDDIYSEYNSVLNRWW